MSDPELIKWLSSLGVGGVLAGILFLVYRKDIKMFTELWKGQSDALMNVVKDNTAAMTRNTLVVESMHKRLDQELRHHREEDRFSVGDQNH